MKLVATYNNDQQSIQKWIIFKQPQFQGSYVRRDKQSVAILTNAFPTVVYVMEVLRVQMALMNQRSFAKVCKVIPQYSFMRRHYVLTVERLWLIHSIKKSRKFVSMMESSWVIWINILLQKLNKIYLYSSKSNNIQ